MNDKVSSVHMNFKIGKNKGNRTKFFRIFAFFVISKRMLNILRDIFTPVYVLVLSGLNRNPAILKISNDHL